MPHGVGSPCHWLYSFFPSRSRSHSLIHFLPSEEAYENLCALSYSFCLCHLRLWHAWTFLITKYYIKSCLFLYKWLFSKGIDSFLFSLMCCNNRITIYIYCNRTTCGTNIPILALSNHFTCS